MQAAPKQPASKHAKERNRADDDDDDGRDDASRVVKPATSQRAEKSAKENSKPDDDDDDGKDDGNGKNDPSTARSGRATSTVKARDTTPPDNLVDWWRWVTKPAAPGPVAKNRGEPLEVNSTPGIARAAPAPSSKAQTR